MKTVKISVFAIGVALSVTPIFNSAQAQSATSSANVVLELQALRTEIAELRDMVERQQFELKKLKQSNAQRLSQQAVGQAGGGYLQGGQGATNSGQAYSQQGIPQQPFPQQSLPQQSLPQQSFPNGQLPSDNLPVQGGDLQVGNQYVGDLSIEQGDLIGGVASDQPAQGVLDASGAQDYVDQTYVDQASAGQAVDPRYSGDREILDNGVEVVDRGLDASVDSVVGRPDGPEIVERSIEGSQASPSAPVLSSDLSSSVDQSASVSQARPQTALPSSVNTTAQNPAPQPRVANGPVISVPSNNNNNGVGNGAQQAGGWGVIDASEPLAAPAQQQQAQANSQTGSELSAPAIAKFTEDQYYDRGFAFLKQSKYDEAVNVFKQQIADHPQGDLADDAHYWIAEAMFISRKPNEARPHLRAIIDNYPQSARLPDAMLKSAYIEQDLGNLIEARILLQEIVARHPSSNAAIAAKNRLENLKSAN